MSSKPITIQSHSSPPSGGLLMTLMKWLGIDWLRRVYHPVKCLCQVCSLVKERSLVPKQMLVVLGKRSTPSTSSGRSEITLGPFIQRMNICSSWWWPDDPIHYRVISLGGAEKCWLNHDRFILKNRVTSCENCKTDKIVCFLFFSAN